MAVLGIGRKKTSGQLSLEEGEEKGGGGGPPARWRGKRGENALFTYCRGTRRIVISTYLATLRKGKKEGKSWLKARNRGKKKTNRDQAATPFRPQEQGRVA